MKSSEQLGSAATRRSSITATLEAFEEGEIERSRRRHFVLWLLNRSRDNRTELEQKNINIFHSLLRSVLSQIFVAIQSIASEMVQGQREVSLLEQLFQFSLEKIPYAGGVLLSIEQSVMDSRYLARLKNVSEKFPSLEHIDAFNEELSARFTAYYQREVLYPIFQEKTGLRQEIQAFADKLKEWVSYSIMDRNKTKNDHHMALICQLTTEMLLVLGSVDFQEDTSAESLAFLTMKHMGRVEPLPLDVWQKTPLTSALIVEDDHARFLQTYGLLGLCQLAGEPQSKLQEITTRWGYGAYFGYSEYESEVTFAWFRPETGSLTWVFKGPEIFSAEGFLKGLSLQLGDFMGGRVYQPFLISWQRHQSRLWPTLRSWLQGQPNRSPKTISLTGHGWGGALASLAACQLRSEFPLTSIVLSTFGTPPVGNEAFCDQLTQCFDTHPGLGTSWFWRVIMEDDVMTTPRLTLAQPMGPKVIRASVGSGVTLSQIPQRLGVYNLTDYRKYWLQYTQCELGINLGEDWDWKEFLQRIPNEAILPQRYLQSRVLHYQSGWQEPVHAGELQSFVEKISPLDTLPLSRQHQSPLGSLVPQSSKSFSDQVKGLYLDFINENDGAFEENLTKLWDALQTQTISYPYSIAREWQNILVHEKFRQASSHTQTLLLQGMTQCLHLGFVKTQGQGEELRSDLRARVKNGLPLSWHAENIALWHAYDAFEAFVVLCGHQQTMRDSSVAQSLLAFCSLTSRPMDAISEPGDQAEYENIKVLLNTVRVLPCFGSETGWLDYTTFVLNQNSLCEDPWLLRCFLVYFHEEIWVNASPTQKTPLGAIFVRFLCQRLARAPGFLGDELFFAPSGSLGLSVWLHLTQKPEPKVFLTLVSYLKEAQRALPNDSLVATMASALQTATTWPYPLTDILRRARNAASSPQDRLRLSWLVMASLEQSLQKPTAEDHYRLGNASLELEENSLALRSYLRAKKMLNQGEKSAWEAKVHESLAQLYVVQASRLSHTPYEAMKGYLNALQIHSGGESAQQGLWDMGLKFAYSKLSARLGALGPAVHTDEEKEIRLAKGETLLTGPWTGSIALLADYTAELWDGANLKASNTKSKSKNILTGSILEGQHRVALLGTFPYQVHIKENPSCPGLAFAAWALEQWLFGQRSSAQAGEIFSTFVPVEPVKIERIYKGRHQCIYAQASETVYGENLKTALGANPQALPPQLLKLQERAFSQFVVMSLLLDLEDARPANLMVAQESDQSRPYLRSIDNDHILVGDVIRDDRLCVKNVAYCFPQMNTPLQMSVVQDLVSDRFTPSEIIRAWLYTLDMYNQRIKVVFGEQEMRSLYDRKKEEDKVILPVFFHENTFARMYIKLSQIRSACRNNQVKTAMDLLRQVQPRLAQIYSNPNTSGPSAHPLAFFEKITEGLFTSRGGTKTTNTELVMLVLGKRAHTYALLEEAAVWPKQLLATVADIGHGTQAATLITNDLKFGNISLFADYRELQPLVLRQFSFAHIKAYTPQNHQSVLKALDVGMTDLTLRENSLLTDGELFDVLSRMTQIKRVEIVGCPKVLGGHIAAKKGLFRANSVIAKSFLDALLGHQDFEELILRDCPHLGPDIWPSLITLCEQRQSLKVLFAANSGLSFDLSLGHTSKIEASPGRRMLSSMAALKDALNLSASANLPRALQSAPQQVGKLSLTDVPAPFLFRLNRRLSPLEMNILLIGDYEASDLFKAIEREKSLGRDVSDRIAYDILMPGKSWSINQNGLDLIHVRVYRLGYMRWSLQEMLQNVRVRHPDRCIFIFMVQQESSIRYGEPIAEIDNPRAIAWGESQVIWAKGCSLTVRLCFTISRNEHLSKKVMLTSRFSAATGMTNQDVLLCREGTSYDGIKLMLQKVIDDHLAAHGFWENWKALTPEMREYLNTARSVDS